MITLSSSIILVNTLVEVGSKLERVSDQIPAPRMPDPYHPFRLLLTCLAHLNRQEISR